MSVISNPPSPPDDVAPYQFPKWWKPFDRESIAQCKRWQAESISCLARGNLRHRALAKKLRGCSVSTPCASEACSHCMYNFRTRLFDQSVSMPFRGGTAATVIAHELMIEVGKLQDLDIRRIIRRYQKRIARSQLKDCLLLGGIDVSLNKEENSIRVYWQVHFYFLVSKAKTKELNSAIRAAFPPEPTAVRPYHLRTITDLLFGVGYSYKMRFEKRFKYLNEYGEAELDPDSKIPITYLPELLLFLDSFAIGGRMLLRGIRRHGRNLNLKIIDPRYKP